MNDTDTSALGTSLANAQQQLEDDGYLLVYVTDMVQDRSEALVFDATDIARGPLATVILPERISVGVHACWVEGDRIHGEHRDSRARSRDERGFEDALPRLFRSVRRDGAGDARERRADDRRDGGERREQRQLPKEVRERVVV